MGEHLGEEDGEATFMPRRNSAALDMSPRRNSGALNKKSVPLSQKESTRRREACESIRTLIFGMSMTGKSKDGKPFYEQRCGTRDDIIQLHRVWCQLDDDGSGDIELQEFLDFFSRS